MLNDDKIKILLRNKINQFSKEEPDPTECEYDYLKKWNIRTIPRHYLKSTPRRNNTTLIQIDFNYYEIPDELIEKALVLGEFP